MPGWISLRIWCSSASIIYVGCRHFRSILMTVDERASKRTGAVGLVQIETGPAEAGSRPSIAVSPVHLY